MAEDLASLYANLNLNADENSVVSTDNMSPPDTDYSLILMGKWLFDKFLLALHEAADTSISSKIPFDRGQFRIQLHNLPLGLRNLQFAKIAGNTVGKFLMIDSDSDGSLIGKYLRINVEVDISKSFRRVLQTSFKGEECFIPIRYERSPDFCFSLRNHRHGERM
ncbi:hypothetical protein DH2020_043330 [Rehmannia glutinosa]|uniref:Uncharacterized protein n=1 Tax=Rehmannia glutinosa TaxID=99300 RepID=A0ABR0UJZ4_REHGL